MKGLKTEEKPVLAPIDKIFECNIYMIEKIVWQDENYLTCEVPVNLQNDRMYGKGKKSGIPDENLLSLTNKMSKKVMVSASISWYGQTNFFYK